MRRIGEKIQSYRADLLTSRKTRAQAVLPGPWRFAWSLAGCNAVPRQFQRRSRPCFAPIALPRAHCISPRNIALQNTTPDAGCRTVHRQKRPETFRDRLPTPIPRANAFAIPPLLRIRVRERALSLPVLDGGIHTFLLAVGLCEQAELRRGACRGVIFNSGRV
jgi:hypothetical protein